MMRRHFGLSCVPSSYPCCFFQLLLILHKSITQPFHAAFLSNTSSLLFLSFSANPPPPPKKKSQTPCLPLTLMPTSLSLPSSAPPPPVLYSTPLHSGFAPTIMSFLRLPLSALTLILPSPPLPLLLSSSPVLLLLKALPPDIDGEGFFHSASLFLSVPLVPTLVPPTQLKLFGALLPVPKKHPIYRVAVVFYLDSSVVWFSDDFRDN